MHVEGIFSPDDVGSLALLCICSSYMKVFKYWDVVLNLTVDASADLVRTDFPVQQF